MIICMIEAKTKVCKTCQLEKLVAEFNKAWFNKKTEKQYYASYCKLCDNQKKKQWKQKYLSILENKIRNNLVTRLRNAGLPSGLPHIKHLGCTLEELINHLESTAPSNFNWKYYGPKGYHIDHVEPVSSFDLTSEEDLKALCHYTNLRILWWEDNLSRPKFYTRA